MCTMVNMHLSTSTKIRSGKLNRYKNFSTATFFEHLPNRPPKRHLLYDVAVVGGGIIGVAIGREITRQSNSIKCVLIEKEDVLGKHQSSHNSGVIHSGIYYKPGSLKAQLCSKGVDRILEYCKEKGIPYTTCGKLILAKNYTECDSLRSLYDQGKSNNVPDIKMLWTKEDMKKIEPKCKGVQALWSPRSGNVDWSLVTENFANDYRKNGDTLLCNEVTEVKLSDDCEYPVAINTKANNIIKSKYLIICGGLQSGILASKVSEETSKNTFVSLKVEYELLENQSFMTNIYGITNGEMPFLGIHISPKPDGSVLLGPAAIPAYGVEYQDQFNFDYIKNTLKSSNFQNMAVRYFMTCLKQVGTTFCADFRMRQLQDLAQIRAEDVKPGPTAIQGILIEKDGRFVNDFIFEFFEGQGIQERIINCKFLPSPAATCSMSIAELVTKKLFQKISENVVYLPNHSV